MRKIIFYELLKGPKPYSVEHDFANELELMFWEGLVTFNGNLVSLTDFGIEEAKKNK